MQTLGFIDVISVSWFTSRIGRRRKIQLLNIGLSIYHWDLPLQNPEGLIKIIMKSSIELSWLRCSRFNCIGWIWVRDQAELKAQPKTWSWVSDYFGRAETRSNVLIERKLSSWCKHARERLWKGTERLKFVSTLHCFFVSAQQEVVSHVTSW